MAIEKIVCPVLNKPFKPVSVVEVFVRFNKAENPTAIMCPYYSHHGGCDFEDATSREEQECIYNYWTKIVQMK